MIAASSGRSETCWASGGLTPTGWSTAFKLIPDAFEKVVYVGDGVWDVRAARALGIGFLGLATGTKAVRLLEEGASCVLPDLSDPMRVVERLEAVARKP
jgi:phosphoglycolate phosphatase-like HAD superfamily hydrolase